MFEPSVHLACCIHIWPAAFMESLYFRADAAGASRQPIARVRKENADSRKRSDRVEEPRREKVPFGNQMVDATPLRFRSAGENWNEYLVDDGSVIRIKLVATDILRVDGQYDQQGNPIYVVKSSNVTTFRHHKVLSVSQYASKEGGLK